MQAITARIWPDQSIDCVQHNFSSGISSAATTATRAALAAMRRRLGGEMASALQCGQGLVLAEQAFDADAAIGQLHRELRGRIAGEDGLGDGRSADVIFQGGDIEQHEILRSGGRRRAG